MDHFKHELPRVAADDPSRCQGNGPHGQCQFGSTEHGKYCALHGGNKAEEKAVKDKLHAYRLGKWESRIRTHASSSNAKSLGAELGILRIMLEEQLEACTSTPELLLRSSAISDLVTKIEKLVLSVHKLDKDMGVTMDQTQAMNFGMSIVGILDRHIDDPELLQKLGDEIIALLAPNAGEE